MEIRIDFKRDGDYWRPCGVPVMLRNNDKLWGFGLCNDKLRELFAIPKRNMRFTLVVSHEFHEDAYHVKPIWFRSGDRVLCREDFVAVAYGEKQNDVFVDPGVVDLIKQMGFAWVSVELGR